MAGTGEYWGSAWWGVATPRSPVRKASLSRRGLDRASFFFATLHPLRVLVDVLRRAQSKTTDLSAQHNSVETN
eukprot:5044362-Pyramimonas_sp.AAC.1